jgi:hypothetical protein
LPKCAAADDSFFDVRRFGSYKLWHHIAMTAFSLISYRQEEKNKDFFVSESFKGSILTKVLYQFLSPCFNFAET